MIKAIAIIPARGGSKGIPRKNILPIAGKPLIAWMIEAAISAKSVGAVYVSTDCPEIAKVAREYGASIIWRPAELSGDFSSSESAILHALETQYPGPTRPPITVFLQCTAPLTTASDIDGTIEALISKDADTAIAVSEFHYFLWEMDEDGNLQGINHNKAIRKMRQERKKQFIENGSVYAMRTTGFLNHKHRFFGKTAHYVVPHSRTIEIDEPLDINIAETLLQRRSIVEAVATLPQKISLVAFDFDGVMTDDTVLISDSGVESVRCSRSDGMGIELARRAGIPMLILSKEKNQVVTQRAKKLQIDVLNGVDDKSKVLNAYLAEKQIPWNETVYIGNDINDKDCLLLSGCGVAVSDARPEVIAVADIVLKSKGGNHAVRELIDLILSR